MRVKIRRAILNDLKQIQQLNLALFQKEINDYDPSLDLNWTFGKLGTKYFKNRIRDKAYGGIWVALDGEKTIGYLSGGITRVEVYRKLPRTAELENTFVEPLYRSKGIGQKLFKEFVQWSKIHHVKKFRVQASAQNKKAIKLYQRQGYKDYNLTLEKDIK